MSRPRVIVNAMLSDYSLVARVAERVLADGYEWPADGITSVSFYTDGQEPWQGRNFGVKRNKSCITIYGPGDEM